MPRIKHFEDLRIWQDAMELSYCIYKDTNDLRDYGFKDQIQRAAISVMNNIAEGFERSSDAEFIKFLYYSKASCGELRSMLYMADKLNYMEHSSTRKLIEFSKKVSGSIANFIKFLRTPK